MIIISIQNTVDFSMGMTLHQHGHTHGGSDHHTHEENVNVRAAFIHVLGDFLQSFGVLVAAIVIYYKVSYLFRERSEFLKDFPLQPEWNIVDPICTFIFSILVVITTFAIIRDTLLVLMEGRPKGIDFNDVMNVFLKIQGVKRVHNLRIWALTLDKLALSAHLAISKYVALLAEIC